MPIRLINLSDRKDHYYLGKWGETLAIHFLRTKGYYLLAANWRKQGCEIDLVMQKDDYLIAVEVKTRRGNSFDFELIHKSQIRRIVTALQLYSHENAVYLTKRLIAVHVLLDETKFLPRIAIRKIL